MTRSLYRVTKAAPWLVCGRRVSPGDELALTEAEARYEVDVGHLELAPAKAPKPAVRRSPGAGVPLKGTPLPADGETREVTLDSTLIPHEPAA